MSRKRDVDWSNWKGHVDVPEHPLSRPLGKAKTGAEAVSEALSTGHLPVIQDAPKQPTDEQMFGSGVVTEEMVKAAEENYKSVFKKHFEGFKAPVDHLNKSKIDERKWAPGKSFNSLLTPQEIAERNRYVDKE